MIARSIRSAWRSLAALFLLGVWLTGCRGAPAASPPASAAADAAPSADATPVVAGPASILRAGDRVCLIGNALAERMQHDGWLETRLAARFPELDLTFRNLGFSGDELTIQQRTDGFGSWDDWLLRCEADVVLAFFGFNESFSGAEGLDAFREDLRAFVRHVRAQRYGDDAVRLVLLTPIAYEVSRHGDLPGADAQNARIEPYARAMLDVAREEDVPCVDLYSATLDHYRFNDTVEGGPLTRDGNRLTSAGNELIALSIDRALTGDADAPLRPLDLPHLVDLRVTVLEKNRIWFDCYRATDGYNVYGGRSALAYTNGQTNLEVLQREQDIRAATAERLDRVIHESARRSATGERGAAGAPEPTVTIPPPIPVPTNRPGTAGGGRHRFVGGEQAIRSMTAAPGLAVGLYADEARFPALANPVQISFDTQGRLWVAAWPSYPHRAPGVAPHDKLLVFEDTDLDGRADTATAFADDLHNPTGFEFWNGGVLVAQAPDLLFLKDVDGDGRADVRERVLHGLSSSDTHHTANSFVLGPDGALYFQEGIFHHSQIETLHGPVRNRDGCVWRFEPRTGRVERWAAYGFLNPHGHVFDRWGQDFVTDGTGNENFWALPLSGAVAHPDKHKGYFTFFGQRSRPAAATEILSSTHFPDDMQGDYLIANVIGFQGIFRYRLSDDGAGFSATEAEPILQSADPNFRPVDLEVGPDGALYVADWQNPLIGHMQHHLRDPSRDHEHGRIYRVSVPGRAPPRPVAVADRPVDELVGLLAHPEDRVRYRTRIELSARDSDEVVRAARAWAAPLLDADGEDREHEHRLLEALWLQQQHGVLDEVLLERLLTSSEPRARAAAVRVLRHMRRDVQQPLERLVRAVADDHPRVRAEAVVALSFFPTARAAELTLAARRAGTDRFLDYAIDETMEALRPAWSAALAAGESFAEHDPDGLAWALARLDTEALAGVRPGRALFHEQLSRPGLDVQDVLAAAEGLAGQAGTSTGDELLAAISRADMRQDGHADHLLSGLFSAVAALPSDARAELTNPLRKLATDGRRLATRRLATVSRMRADGSVDAAWDEVMHSPEALAELLDAALLLDDSVLARSLFRRVHEILETKPDADAGTSGPRGRYVRVSLPGPERTLTLAEVEVESGGYNIAPQGTATQSSEAWGGSATRAIDGNSSGVFADGGQSHTREDQADPWWELDLGSTYPLDTITLWNRTEAAWGERLSGWVITVLDHERRTVFEAGGDDSQAPSPSVRIELVPPGLRLRRAAVRCLASLGVQQELAALALISRFQDPELQPTIVSALRDLPMETWSDHGAGYLARSLLIIFFHRPPEDFETPHGRQLLALADDVAPLLLNARVPQTLLAERLIAARRSLGPIVIVIRPVPDSLLYDRKEFTVVAGRAVELVFDNTDIMPHNLVLTVPGALATVGLAAEAMAALPDAWERGFVPDRPEVLHATRLLAPGQSQTLRFRAPELPGDHPYVCTFPGHWIRMNGVMHVVTEDEQAQTARSGDGGPEDAGSEADPAPDGGPGPTRPFVRHWRRDDFPARLPAAEGGAAERGRIVLEAASCLLCHAVDGEGGRTGPDLREAASRHPRDELLTQVLEPSAVIAEGYASEMFFLEDGGVIAGRVLAEDDTGVSVQDDPYRDAARVLRHEEIGERRTSEISVMPEGLLSTFTREEILDLVTYLDGLRVEADAR